MATVYEEVGGQEYFDRLVAAFYRAVDQDPVLRPLYPDDLGGPERHLAWFLGQYWGGPRTYSDERGHPRLRMRHAPFVIGLNERNAWLRHMVDAVKTSGVSAEIEAQMIEYFEMSSRTLINSV
ncbi:MAG: globin [Acidimicrobiales bacterium]